MSRMVRTFVAVEIDEAVRQRASALIERARASIEGIRWVGPQNLHVTLKFLGDVAEEDLPAVGEAVTQAVAGVPGFDFELRALGAFPRIDRPNNVWLGSGDGAASLADLADRIERALNPLGFPREHRTFEPHVTLGRVARGGRAPAALVRWLRENAAFEAGRSRIREVVVFSSQLTPQGAIYTALCRAPLASMHPSPP